MGVNVRVVLRKDENIERALKRFKTLCERAGIKKQVKERRYYTKPSEVRRNKKRKQLRDLNKTKRDKFRKKPTVRFLPPQVGPKKEPLSSESKPHETAPELAKV
jgi:small subunit ribosomal protein S21